MGHRRTSRETYNVQLNAMKGVISAGSIPTAQAGAEVLANGGNAVDAAVAACFAVAAGEPTLTSLAGGGMMIVRSGATGEVSVLDFFGNAPKLRQAEGENLDFYNIDLSYGPTTQSFYVGAGAAGVPGVIPGLCTALDRWGRFSLSDMIQPACRLLRNGAVIGDGQAALAQFLKPILVKETEPRATFAPSGRYLESGDTFRLPKLADTLEALARTGWTQFYDGPMRNRMLAQFGPERGGLLTPADFDDYAVLTQEPLCITGSRSKIYTMPPPAAGGPMIGLMRRLYSDPDYAAHSRELRLCAAMATADAARIANRLMGNTDNDGWCHDDYRLRLTGQLLTTSLSGGPSSTTHISVVDQAGNAVGVTFSHGESNASMIEDMGIMMNNFLGEEDLLPHGLGTAPAGQRLATMMSPTLVEGHDGTIYVLGTGGSNRIRTSILQVIGYLLDDGQTPDEAVRSPRLHHEAGILNAEVFPPARSDVLASIPSTDFVPFDAPHLFFGGVNLAVLQKDGTLSGGADPRRGGHSIIV